MDAICLLAEDEKRRRRQLPPPAPPLFTHPQYPTPEELGAGHLQTEKGQKQREGMAAGGQSPEAKWHSPSEPPDFRLGCSWGSRDLCLHGHKWGGGGGGHPPLRCALDQRHLHKQLEVRCSISPALQSRFFLDTNLHLL